MRSPESPLAERANGEPQLTTVVSAGALTFVVGAGLSLTMRTPREY
jgi:hypothetical protein